MLTRDQCVALAIGHVAATRPVVYVHPFTQGVHALFPVGAPADVLLRDMAPAGDDHTWHEGSLLVERRYANDFVGELRRRGVFVP